MEKFKNLDAIIFDLDGTLWDACDALTDSYNKICREYGQDEVGVDLVRSLMGKRFDAIFGAVFPGLGKEHMDKVQELQAKYEDIVIRENKGGVVFEGMRETLDEINKNIKIYIVSNCQDGYVEAFADVHDMWDYFEDYENPGRTGLDKAENIKLVLDRNNIKNAIYIGDTQHDKDSAKEAGLPFVFADYGFGDVDEYDAKITKPSDLLDLIEL